MIFDGDKISIGDTVFDVVFGAGRVEQIIEAEGKFSVRYGTGNRIYVYSSAGVSNFPEKTLYWHDPVKGYTPMKDDKKWAHFCELRDALASVIWKSDSNAY